jgi:hypothetical protein
VSGSETVAAGEAPESCSVEQAAAHALQWCAAHPGWQRLCDLDAATSAALDETYAELPARERRHWERQGGEAAWREFGTRRCKVPHGFISGKGEFYEDVLAVPPLHNLMSVFQTSVLITRPAVARQRARRPLGPAQLYVLSMVNPEWITQTPDARSVRVLRSLEARGLVYQNRGRWYIAPAGLAALEAQSAAEAGGLKDGDTATDTQD